MAPAASREYRGLPEPILAYLKKTADPRLLLKLMQVSRYFCYTEFPYMVVVTPRYYEGGCDYWKRTNSRAWNRETLDFDNLTKPLWISNHIILNRINFSDPNDSNLLSFFLSKIAVCDVTALDISGQNLTMKQFEILISSKNVKNFKFYRYQVKYDNGNVVPLDEMVKLLPNLKEYFWYPNRATSSCFTPTTTAKLVAYLNPSTLTRFEVQCLTEIFDFKLFAEFMDKHHSIHFRLGFDNHVSYSYLKIVYAYIDKWKESGEYENRNFMIKFPYLDDYH